MKASVVCLLFASLLMIVFSKGTEGRKWKNAEKEGLKRRQKFNAYDADGDGYIDMHELRIKGSAEGFGEAIEAIMDDADKDGDGNISYEEFGKSSLGIIE